MAEIFLSYTRSDRAVADKIVQRLRDEGLSVWWDDDLLPAGDFAAEIMAKVESARVMIVLWSRQSVDSSWVKTEADVMAKQGRLITVLVEDVRPPLGFTGFKPVDLRGWQGESASRQWQELLAAVRRLLEGPPERDVVRRFDPVDLAEYPTFDPGRAPRVFIAHTTADKPRIRPFVEILMRSGLPLWIDKPHRMNLPAELEGRLLSDRIRYGSDWREGLRKAILSTDLVLGFWSETARSQVREQFHYELFQGLRQNKLHLCRIDDISYERIGTPYTFLHIADLSDFREDRTHPELRIMMEDFAHVSRGPEHDRPS